MHLRKIINFLAFAALILWICPNLQAAGDPDSPLGLNPVPWAPPSSASIVKALTGFGEHRIYQEGKETCLESKLIFFQLDDAYAFDLKETVQMTVRFDSRFGPEVILSYDGSDRPMSLTIDAKKLHSVATGPAWLKEYTFALQGARLANQFPGYTDFNLVGSNYKTIGICDLKIERPQNRPIMPSTATLSLRVIDSETKARVSAQVGIYDQDGKFINPSRQALPVSFPYGDMYSVALWFPYLHLPPFDGRYSFYVDGNYETKLPPGTYEVIVSHGPEFRVYREKIIVKPESILALTASLKRWQNLPAKGWYSGDNHVHIKRNRENNTTILALTKAADLHVTSLLEMGNVKNTYYTQYGFGKSGEYHEGSYYLVSGQEEPRTAQMGHMMFLNQHEPFHLKQDYFEYQRFIEKGAAQNALIGFAHQGKLFQADKGLALEIPFLKVQFLEVLQSANCYVDKWYEFLNLGFKVNPLAGSDFPYIDLPGNVRNYVHVEKSFTPESWFRALQQGQTFVTNGPILNFSVNGLPMGAEVRVKKGDLINVQARSELNDDFGRLKRLTVISQGQVLREKKVRGSQDLQMEFTYPAKKSHWLVLSTSGSSGRTFMTAHSAPIYVVVDGEPFWNEQTFSKLVQSELQILDDLEQKPLLPENDLEWWQTKTSLEKQWREQKSALNQRILEAKEEYYQLRQRFFTQQKSAHP